MRKYLPHAAFVLVLSIVPFIPRGNASISPHVESPPAPQVLHPSRAVDAQGYFFAHDLRSESNGTTTLITTVGTATVTLSDGSRVAGGDIRIMEYFLTTDDIAKAMDNAAYYDNLVAGMYRDSIIELQFKAQLATFRQRAIDMTTIRSGLSARIVAAKSAPSPVINSTVVLPPSSGSCSLKP